MSGIKDKYAIVGLGYTAQGVIPGKTAEDIRVEAVDKAIQDSGLPRSSVDGYIWQNDDRAYTAGDVPRRLGLEPKFMWGMQSGGVTAISSIVAAIGAMEAGIADCVVSVYASNARSSGRLVGGSDSNVDHKGAFGMYSPGAEHALAARRHMHEYGTTRSQLASIAITERDNALKRPDAWMHDRPFDLDTYMNGRMIADPLNLFDYCLVNDGGVAIVITSAEKAQSLKSQPIYIMGTGLGHRIKQVHNKEHYLKLDVDRAKDTAFNEAGITLEDVDVTQLYDCFTITVLLETEDYGFCAKGEGGAYWEDGHASLSGKTPINTSGNNMSWGYNQGMTPICESVLQLRGQAGDTQVKDAEIALASGHGTTSTGSQEEAHGTLVLRR